MSAIERTFSQLQDHTWVERIALPAATLLFLFAGLYKGIIPSPIDLTVLAVGLVLATLWCCRYAMIGLLRQSPVILLLILSGYLAIRLLPGLPSWGVRKLMEIMLFGAPALAAGYVIASSPDALDTMTRWLARLGVPAALCLVIYAVLNDPYMPAEIGSGGYQLTGFLLALCTIAAAVRGEFVYFAYAFLGVNVSGHISGTAFAAAAAAVTWIARRDWKGAAACVASALAMLVLYAALIAPPQVMVRILWKVGATVMLFSGITPALPAEQAQDQTPGSFGTAQATPGSADVAQMPAPLSPSANQTPNSAEMAQAPVQAPSSPDTEQTSGQAETAQKPAPGSPNSAQQGTAPAEEGPSQTEIALQNSGVAGRLVVWALKLSPSADVSSIGPASADRFEIFASAIRQFLSAPIFGRGYGTLSYAGGDARAHNIVLEMLAEGGLIAGVLLVLALGSTLCRLWPLPKDPGGQFITGYVLFMILTYMVSGYWGSRLMLFGIGMAIAPFRARVSSTR